MKKKLMGRTFLKLNENTNLNRNNHVKKEGTAQYKMWNASTHVGGNRFRCGNRWRHRFAISLFWGTTNPLWWKQVCHKYWRDKETGDRDEMKTWLSKKVLFLEPPQLTRRTERERSMKLFRLHFVYADLSPAFKLC